MALKDFLAAYGTLVSDLPFVPDYRGRSVVVCGDAACVWDDLERFGCRSGNGVAKEGWDFFTVNGITASFPGKIEHCYSNSLRVIRNCIINRRDEYKDEFGYPKHVHSRDGAVGWPWHGEGTSGLGAVLCAVAMGYDRIVLAGMPLDDGPHNGEPAWRRTRFTKEVPSDDIHWRRLISFIALDENGPVIASLSGRTAAWLGSPSEHFE